MIKPALLVWARNSAGLDQAAVSAKLKVPLDKLKKWEAGEARPSIAQLRKVDPGDVPKGFDKAQFDKVHARLRQVLGSFRFLR